MSTYLREVVAELIAILQMIQKRADAHKDYVVLDFFKWKRLPQIIAVLDEMNFEIEDASDAYVVKW